MTPTCWCRCRFTPPGCASAASTSRISTCGINRFTSTSLHSSVPGLITAAEPAFFVETLQANRTEAVHLLDQLARQLPDGIYLKSVKQTEDKINLTGYAQSNARIATLMRNLDSSPWLSNAELVETKAVQLNNLRVNEFSLNIQLKREQGADTGKPAAKEKGA